MTVPRWRVFMRVIKFGLISIVLTLIIGCSSSVTELEKSKLTRLETENSLLKQQIAQLNGKRQGQRHIV